MFVAQKSPLEAGFGPVVMLGVASGRLRFDCRDYLLLAGAASAASQPMWDSKK